MSHPAPTPPSLGSRFRWFIGTLLFLGTTINYIDRQILALLKPMLDETLHWTNEQYGQVNSAFQASYAVSYIFFGWFIDRVGVKLGYSISIIAWSLAALAHGFVGSITGFFFARIALGVGEGGNFPACVKAVMHWYPPKERALGASYFNAGPNVAAVLAPALVPLIAYTWGWQAAFVAAGAAGFLWLVLFLPFYKNEPSQSRFVSASEREWIAGDQESTMSTGVVPWKRLFRMRQAWAIFIAKFLTDPIFWFFLTWLPDFFKKTRGLDLKGSWLHLVTTYAIATVLSVVGGWFSGHLIQRGWSATRARKTAMFVFAILIIPVAFATKAPEWVAVFLVGLAAAAHQAWSATLYATGTDMFPKRTIAAIAGIGGGIGSLGGIMFPIFAGRMLDHYKLLPGGETAGYTILFTICGSAYVVAFLINHALAPKYVPVEM
jgi:ACS family hexuronate transporter-like MFS transporter